MDKNEKVAVSVIEYGTSSKLNKSKEAQVPQVRLQHLQPSFLPRNRQQVPAQKAIKEL